ncbi:ABC transporter ATP-binding protein [Pseudoduganella ginsengisoli]|uniref:ATP-binding cassette domain-containing protein n=1 Tax=Pseudoduganella ginsengisoli TaxID=1462440 RepID=A0A6L6PVH7_9BURK|nr:ABC transporter ATP-binding protein [Pseudoduganella ginsengisoli]MTW01445.1 ATP-binding cassette domain-containing protein [Pseudoduganella ginsengisoli]
MADALQVTQVRAGYGAINVLWDVSLAAAPGELTAIIGPNGAGKTTLLRAIMGLLPLNGGSVTLGAQRLDRVPVWQLAQMGVALIPEGRMLFDGMTVEDNLLIGAFPSAQRAYAARRLEAAYAMFPKLRERRRQLAGSLSGGEAQMLVLARGLMADPKVLLVDEPSLGLAPVVVDELFGVLARLRQEGLTIVLVEQHTERAVAIADHVHLMQSGKVVLSQRAKDVRLPELHEQYFGLA